jgi:hypothetical protein
MKVEPGSPAILYAIAAGIAAGRARVAAMTAQSRLLHEAAEEHRAEAIAWLAKVVM